MKLPDWYVATPVNEWEFTTRIRRWHPGWWLTVAHVYWDAWRHAGLPATKQRKVIPHG